MKKLVIGFLAITLVALFAMPAVAGFEPHASLRVAVGWWDFDPEDAAGNTAEGGLVDLNIKDRDYETIMIELGDFSRFGAKWTGGDLSAHFELGLKGDGRGGNSAYSRLLYGTWKFKGGSLMVGQNYDPYTFISDQMAPRLADLGGQHVREIDAENLFIGYGCLWDSRQPQIKLILDSGLYLAAIQPDTEDGDLDVDHGDADLPKLCVGWEIKRDNLFLNPGFAYNSIEASKEGIMDEEDLDSWLCYLNGKFALGPADIKGSIHYGQNLGNFGLWNREAAAYAKVDGDDFEDSDCYGGYVQLAFPLDPATITLGVGYTESENDAWGDGDEDDQMSYFINAKIPFTDNFWVIPEFSYYDHGDDFVESDVNDWEDGPTAWFAGALLRMDF